ncbi:actin-7-related [Anaeramoeba ignava]|uniref:Actin-7-related n=1 Tax=Anaeramoeba ignava TaxID=1746090 RepID=A0A9Q0L8W3_ANAIG|nr:actin-7-related [Anaeramoeba ignava]
MSEENPAIVIDNGSGIIKAGFAGEEEPKTIFRTVIGRKENFEDEKNIYFGEEILKEKGKFLINYPMEHGIITNWDEMEKIWEHLFDHELKVETKEKSVLITEPFLNPKSNREKMTEIMFETFHVPNFYIAIQEVLSLYASGRITGIVVQLGDGICSTFPIYEGLSLSHAALRMNFGGRDINDYLMKILTERGYFFESAISLEIVNEIKEKNCFVSLDFQQEMEKAKNSNQFEKNFQASDGNIYTIANERFRAPEVLFQPDLIGLEKKGIDKMISNSILKCDVDLKKNLFENIVLSGGSVLFQGMKERIENEVIKFAPQSIKVKVDQDSNPKISTWIGGSILASLTSLKTKWITQDDYDEFGFSIIHSKCF